MNVHFLTLVEKKELMNQLDIQYGIQDLPYLLFETGKEKIRGFSGSLSKDELLALSEAVHIEIIGLYLLKKEHGLRLSFDATQLLQKQITKNILDINKEQYEQWIRGHDIEMQAPSGTLMIRYGNDCIGCGKSTGERIINHVPKERRLRK